MWLQLRVPTPPAPAKLSGGAVLEQGPALAASRRRDEFPGGDRISLYGHVSASNVSVCNALGVACVLRAMFQ